ncbi:subunit beta of pyruvate dehydrogenase E1 [Chloropicon primus]|nr:subunit beta of pyruvate dehydrogenase E1 [Chloropicon primus]
MRFFFSVRRQDQPIGDARANSEGGVLTTVRTEMVSTVHKRHSVGGVGRQACARSSSGALAARRSGGARWNARVGRPSSTRIGAEEKEMLMWEALREATDEEMERDPTVLVMGEDVGHYGGSYKVTYDLYKKYGEMRLLDTPIAENSFAGMGIGAAMTGLRPIIEGMNMGFLLLAFNQISNNCGMLHYTSGGQYKVPVVIRGPGGVGRQLGAEHSQRLESYFQSIPGVQLVACSTARNSKALLKAAIRSDNPVIFFEHVLLYNVKGPVGGKDEVQELNRAEVVREGSDITILCYSRMRYVSMQAVGDLVTQGYDPEVIDLISLKPFDLETIYNSLKKTRKVLIVEECMKTGGIGASLSSTISENFIDELDHEVVRLSSQDVPTAYAHELEAATIVQPEQVVDAVHKMCGSAIPA